MVKRFYDFSYQLPAALPHDDFVQGLVPHVGDSDCFPLGMCLIGISLILQGGHD